MLANTADAGGTPAKFFHWTVALLLLLQIGLGFAAALWRLSPLKLELFVWHKSTGMLILVLMLARLAWRLANRSLALPLSGWVINSAAGVPFSVFWLVPLPPIVAPDEHGEELAKLVHFSLLVALCLVLAVHIGAALRHHLIKRNDVLLRMLPATWRHR